MAKQLQSTSLDVADGQPLIGIPLEDNARQFVRYFTDEAAADKALARRRTRDVHRLAGAWTRVDPDLDWEALADELDRIRHENEPTPPVDLGL